MYPRLNIVGHGNSRSNWYLDLLQVLRPTDIVNERSIGNCFIQDLTADFYGSVHQPFYQAGMLNIVIFDEFLDSIHDDPVVNTAVVNNANTTSDLVLSYFTGGYVAEVRSRGPWKVFSGTVTDTTEYAATPAYKAAREATSVKLRTLAYCDWIIDWYARSWAQDASNSTYWEADGLHPKNAFAGPAGGAGNIAMAANANEDINSYLLANYG